MRVDILGLHDIRHRELASSLRLVILQIEERAIADLARRVGTGIDRLLQKVRVPALDEVAVVAVPGRIAVGNDELALAVPERVRVPDRLVEQRHEPRLEAFRAHAIHDFARIGHVGLVVVGIHVLAVPARREHQLEADSVRAVLIQVRLVRQGMAIEGRFRISVVVETVEPDGLLLQRELRCLRA